MKRLLALLLCLFIMLTFAACGKEKTKNNNETHSVDVEYYAKIGQIPEHKYHLGSDAKEMKEDFDAEDQKNADESEDGHTHSVYSLMEDDDYTILAYENANYYYKDDGKISAIVSLDSSYDFQIGDFASQIKKVVGEAEEKDGNKEAIFFLPAPDSYTYLEYTFGENTLVFVFESNSLCATALYTG